MSAPQTYTFALHGTFKLQWTFRADEVEPEDGDPESPVPSEAALGEVARELSECLDQKPTVEAVSLETDSDDLLGAEF